MPYYNLNQRWPQMGEMWQNCDLGNPVSYMYILFLLIRLFYLINILKRSHFSKYMHPHIHKCKHVIAVTSKQVRCGHFPTQLCSLWFSGIDTHDWQGEWKTQKPCWMFLVVHLIISGIILNPERTKNTCEEFLYTQIIGNRKIHF